LASAIKKLSEARKHPADSILKFSTKNKEMDLINMQINGVMQKISTTLDNVKKDRYAQGIEALKDKLDELLLNSTN
jgi:hypothetical protein